MNSLSTHTIRVAGLSALAFMVMCSYSLSRHPVDSLFLQHHSSSSLPIVWLLSAAVAAIVMAIYNHYNVRHPLLKLFSATSFISASLLGIGFIAYRFEVPGSVYFLYLWKELYVVLLVEIFWSFSDVVFTLKSARWLYGFLLASGSIGSFVGNTLVSAFAQELGSTTMLLYTIPVLLIAAVVSAIVASLAGDKAPHLKTDEKPHWGHSFAVVRQSTYLFPLLFLVGVIQICVALIDYQFNYTLESHFPITDERTSILGKVYVAIDIMAFAFQICSGWALKLLGVGGALLGIPLVLGTASFVFITIPQFFTMATLKVASKGFDYSLFKACKEMLYIPLNREEKTQGKAFIDFFVYRLAKGISSIIVLVLVYFSITSFSTYITIILIIFWLLLTHIIVKRYKKHVQYVA